MLVHDVHQTKDYFKHQKYISAISVIIIYQLSFYFAIALIAYSVLTLNIYTTLILLFIFVAQLPIKRSRAYAHFAVNILQPLKYFDQFKIYYQQQQPQDEKCVFGCHPHSVFSFGVLGAMNFSEKGQLANMSVLASRFILNFPISGGLMKLWGVKSVDPKNMKKMMRQGKSIGLLPGGFEEATLTSTKEMRCWISNRKGFIKYALEHGYTIRPLLVLGQHQAFSTFEPWLKFRLFLNKLKIPAVMYWNNRSGIFLPSSARIHVIVGKGISCPLEQGQSLTQQMIDTTHKHYVDEILRVYHKHRHLNNDKPIKIY